MESESARQGGYQAVGTNDAALFTLKVHRGEGMALLAMNWREGRPPADFVGFSIQYREPGGDRYYPLQNRLGFLPADGEVKRRWLPTSLAPIQMFRWIHFPRNAELAGKFAYRISPVFMNAADELSYGESQEASLELRRETYPGQLNVAFTRGFVSSQAFVDRFAQYGPISSLLPASSKTGLTFEPTHPKTAKALPWMGFEARAVVLSLLDEATADDSASVYAVAYDLSEVEVVSRLEDLGSRLRAIIDDSEDHAEHGSGENQAEERLVVSAGRSNVKRQDMGGLQHNKMLIIDGSTCQAVLWGSTNFSWRGFYVQANNALVVRGPGPVALAREAFDAYWEHDDAAGFEGATSTSFADVGLEGVDVQVAFSPHGPDTTQLDRIGKDIEEGTTSSLLYSLAFLGQTEGAVREAITRVTENDEIFVYGMADKDVGGIEIHQPDGNPAPVRPAALSGRLPDPFRSEVAGGSGIRLHHKFVVIDFDKPTARVYTGSYNFSQAADTQNGENLVLIKDRRVAVAYAVEALRLFDHYQFRIRQQQTASDSPTSMTLQKPPRRTDEAPWWKRFYADPSKVRDRERFA